MADRVILSSDIRFALPSAGREVSRRQLNEEIDVLIVEIDRPCKDGEEGPCKGEQPLSHPVYQQLSGCLPLLSFFTDTQADIVSQSH